MGQKIFFHLAAEERLSNILDYLNKGFFWKLWWLIPKAVYLLTLASYSIHLELTFNY